MAPTMATPTNFDLGASMAVLERTPAVLRALLVGLPDRWTTINEGGDTWNPMQVVAHLIHGERTDWIPRARIILAQGADREFEPFDRFAHLNEDQGRTISQLLDEFVHLRADGLTTLRGWHLTDAHLELTGVHPEFGEVTLKQLLATWTAHDLGHLVQVARTMARQYRDDAGPWRAYLSVLK
jgi:hypothetical protein